MKRDPKGSRAQRWAADVEYCGTRECAALKIDRRHRCLTCHSSSWEFGERADGGILIKLICRHPSVPSESGIKVAEGGKCKNFWFKEA